MNTAATRSMVRKIPAPVRETCRTIGEAGHEVFVVGGAVRDLVRRVAPGDYDVATSARPGEIRGLFRRVIPTGVEHGTVTVLMKGMSIEITTYRTESAYSDGRHPDSVQFGASLREDLSRRDFTMNGIALDPISGQFVDPFAGEADIRASVIRAIGSPAERFREDALRVLRAVRFAAQLSFGIEDHTWEALVNAAPTVCRVSTERIRDEIDRILRSQDVGTGLRLLGKSGLLSVILPELAEGVGVEQRGMHAFDVFEHSVRACEAAPRENHIVRLAALYHDIGKPRSLAVDTDGQRTFHGHEIRSAQMAGQLLKRLRYPNATIDVVTHLIGNHMFHYTPEWSGAAVRRFLARVGPEHLENLFDLRRADTLALRGRADDLGSLDAFGNRITEVLARDHALTRKDLAVNGEDLATVGVPRGPVMGAVIDHLLETVLDDPAQNHKEQLLDIARRFYQSRLRNPGSTNHAG